MPFRKKAAWAIAAGLVGVLFLTGVYFGIVSLAESPRHAIDLFWQDRQLVLPIVLGFGFQSSLFIILKKRLFVTIPALLPASGDASGAITGASGTTSTLAMIACCAHHATDFLPVLGLTAAAAFLGRYRTQFMLVGLGTTLIGIAVMLAVLFRERRKAFEHMQMCTSLSSTEVS